MLLIQGESPSGVYYFSLDVGVPRNDHICQGLGSKFVASNQKNVPCPSAVSAHQTICNSGRNSEFLNELNRKIGGEALIADQMSFQCAAMSSS